MQPKKRTLWGTRFGFYIAAIGSAFGLGNLWRFPYITAQSGGGAFVLLYVMMALAVGMPLLIGELMLGKLTRKTVIAGCRQLGEGQANRNIAFNTWVGRLSVLVCLMAFSYYAVISGWVLHFLMQFSVGHLAHGNFDVDASMKVLRDNGLLQIALTSVHLLISLIIVVKGVQEGIEKWVSHIMPVFLILLILLLTKALSLPTSTSALRFLFYPDFSTLTMQSMLHALGHVLFTLSIGFGTMVTFGSYLNEKTHIPSAGFRVTVMDTTISLIAGMLIFPLLVGTGVSSTGPELLFQTMPQLLMNFEFGFFFGLAFYLCLYLAALGASIGLLESIVSNLIDFRQFTRIKSTWISGGLALVISIPPALASTTFRSYNLGGRNLLEMIDGALVNWLLPIAALGVALIASRRLKRESMRNEFINDDSPATQKLFSHWLFVLRWIVPAIVILAMVLALIGIIVEF